jgi:hypothetical protein
MLISKMSHKGKGGQKSPKKSVTYYLNGPLPPFCDRGLLEMRVPSMHFNSGANSLVANGGRLGRTNWIPRFSAA